MFQQHFKNPYSGSVANRDAMRKLNRLSRDFDMSIVSIHHFTKGKTGSVQSQIGGQGVLQNMSKAIYVVGEHEATLGTSRRYLACVRMARPPQSLAFDLTTARVRGRGEAVPILEYVGFADVTADDVAAVAAGARTGGLAHLWNAEQAADFCRSWFEARDYAPAKVADLDRAAVAADAYFSRSTFARGREMAGVQPISRSALAQAMDTDWLDDADLRAHWVTLPRPSPEEEQARAALRLVPPG